MKIILYLVSITIFLTLSSCIVEEDSNDPTGSPAAVTDAKEDHTEAVKEYEDSLDKDGECASTECEEAETKMADALQQLTAVIEKSSYAHSIETIDHYTITSSDEGSFQYNDNYYFCNDSGEPELDEWDESVNYSLNDGILKWSLWDCEVDYYTGSHTTIYGQWNYDSTRNEPFKSENDWCDDEMYDRDVQTAKETKTLTVSTDEIITKTKMEFNCLFDDFAFGRRENTKKINCNSWSITENEITETVTINWNSKTSTIIETKSYKSHSCTKTESNSFDNRDTPTCGESNSSYSNCYDNLVKEYCTDNTDDDSYRCEDYCYENSDASFCESYDNSDYDGAYKRVKKQKANSNRPF